MTSNRRAFLTHTTSGAASAVLLTAIATPELQARTGTPPVGVTLPIQYHPLYRLLSGNPELRHALRTRSGG
jgi:hypothetical protein